MRIESQQSFGSLDLDPSLAGLDSLTDLLTYRDESLLPRRVSDDQYVGASSNHDLFHDTQQSAIPVPDLTTLQLEMKQASGRKLNELRLGNANLLAREPFRLADSRDFVEF
jgi:hypothetical protein